MSVNFTLIFTILVSEQRALSTEILKGSGSGICIVDLLSDEARDKLGKLG